MKYIFILLSIFLLGSHGCQNNRNENSVSTSTDPTTEKIKNDIEISYTIKNIYKHNSTYYTQGLIYINNEIIEGTGLRGESLLVKYDLKSGNLLKKLSLAQPFFGEGITIFKNKVYQLTWQEHKVFVYDTLLNKIKEFSWTKEGWGLTNNDSLLVLSDGTNILYFIDPETFNIVNSLGVIDQNNNPVGNLNELEWVNGSIYANIYGLDYIVKINPNSGKIEGIIDLANILIQIGQNKNPLDENPGYVLNGIAYNKKKNTFLITGKCWSEIIEIALNE